MALAWYLAWLELWGVEGVGGLLLWGVGWARGEVWWWCGGGEWWLLLGGWFWGAGGGAAAALVAHCFD